LLTGRPRHFAGARAVAGLAQEDGSTWLTRGLPMARPVAAPLQTRRRRDAIERSGDDAPIPLAFGHRLGYRSPLAALHPV
jgi:hypothetical protein